MKYSYLFLILSPNKIVNTNTLSIYLYFFLNFLIHIGQIFTRLLKINIIHQRKKNKHSTILSNVMVESKKIQFLRLK